MGFGALMSLRRVVLSLHALRPTITVLIPTRRSKVNAARTETADRQE
jgi:hypothetical protein